MNCQLKQDIVLMLAWWLNYQERSTMAKCIQPTFKSDNCYGTCAVSCAQHFLCMSPWLAQHMVNTSPHSWHSGSPVWGIVWGLCNIAWLRWSWDGLAVCCAILATVSATSCVQQDVHKWFNDLLVLCLQSCVHSVCVQYGVIPLGERSVSELGICQTKALYHLGKVHSF